MSLSLGGEDLLFVLLKWRKRKRPIPLGSRVSGNAALGAAQHSCGRVRSPIRVFALKGEDSCGNS